MDDDRYKCAKCGSEKNLSYEPTFSQLYFGGFLTRQEYRCRQCEREMTKIINQILAVDKAQRAGAL